MYTENQFTVDALQWDGTNQVAIRDAYWAYGGGGHTFERFEFPQNGSLVMVTNYGMTITIPADDYLVSVPGWGAGNRWVMGQATIVTAQDFAARYSAV